MARDFTVAMIYWGTFTSPASGTNPAGGPFSYGCGSFRVRAGQAPSVYWPCVMPG